MSIELKRFPDPSGAVELWAPDLNLERLWLCDDHEQRVDLSIAQAKELRDFLIELLPM